MPEEEKLNLVSEKIYLLAFCVGLFLVAIFLLMWVIPQGFIEYNFGINIVSSLFSTILTVIFLSVFLAVREEREWKNVKSAVYSMLSMQSGLLFGELLKFVEDETDEIGFKFSLSCTKDAKIRKEMIFSKLSELNKKAPLQLTSSYVSIYRSNRDLVKLFSDVKRDMGDIQVRYGRHLTSKITERLIRIQDLLELVNLSFELDLRWNELKGKSPLVIDLVNKLISNQTQGQELASIDLIQKTLPSSINTLIREIYELWKMGIEFDHLA